MIHNFHPICHTWIRIPPSAETRLLFFKKVKMKMNMSLYSTKQKQTKWQGNIDSTENPKEKRMYAVLSAGKKCSFKHLNSSYQTPTLMQSSCLTGALKMRSLPRKQ